MKWHRSLLLGTCAIALVACEASEEEHRIVGQLASDRVELTAEFAEPITELLVAEGERVAAGQVLMRQDDSRARARLAEAEAARGRTAELEASEKSGAGIAAS